MNKEVMSRLAINKFEFCLRISREESTESFALHALNVKSFSKGRNNLTFLYVGAPMAESIERKRGRQSITFYALL